MAADAIEGVVEPLALRDGVGVVVIGIGAWIVSDARRRRAGVERTGDDALLVGLLRRLGAIAGALAAAGGEQRQRQRQPRRLNAEA
jgi:hypothetical protein